MRFFFIVNPAAGRSRLWGRFQGVWPDPGSLEFRLTERRGHAVELAAQAAGRGYARIVAVGGDGTLNEAAHGILSSGALPAGLALAHLPTGSGCDFARHAGIPRKPESWTAYLREGRIFRLDAGLAIWAGGLQRRHFVNIAMAGLPGDIVHSMERTGKPLGGALSYLLVSLARICAARAKPLRLRCDPGGEREGSFHMIALANTSTSGGGMRIAPQADAQDGLLDLVTVEGMGRLELLKNFPRIYAGTHLQVKGVRNGRVRFLEASGLERVRLNLDGEPLGELPARFEVLPAALPMLLR